MPVLLTRHYMWNQIWFWQRITTSSKQETESWTKVRSALQEAGNRLFGLFLKSLTSTLHSEVKASLSSQASPDVVASLSAFSVRCSLALVLALLLDITDSSGYTNSSLIVMFTCHVSDQGRQTHLAQFSYNLWYLKGYNFETGSFTIFKPSII